MARQLRIEYQGAFYHAYSRGNQKQPVFLTDEDRSFFIRGLRMAHERFGIAVHAYCLMPNHFHLIIETPKGNLSRAMHFLITGYTVYFNKKHKRHGHLFQGRFRSILIEAVVYARELSRYVHLNPVRAGLVDAPDEFRWSSYGYFLGTAAPGRWLDTHMILRLFSDDLKRARRVYAAYVDEGIGLNEPAMLKDSVKRGILGSEEFIARIKKERLRGALSTPDREIPQLRKLRDKPDLSRILVMSKRVLSPGNKWVIPMAILISHTCTCSTLGEIGKFFSLSISGASNACKRAQRAIDGNSALSQAAEEMKREIGRKL